MTNQPTPSNLKVFPYEVSCLIVASTEDEAFRALNDMLVDAARYWIDEGAPVSDEETAELLAARAPDVPVSIAVQIDRSHD